jgi:hypothetical protein
LNGLDRNVFAGWANDFLISNPARAAIYLKRAERLQRAGAQDPMWLDSWLRLLPVYRKWLADDLDGTLSTLTATVTNDAPRLETSPRINLYLDAGDVMMALGRVRDAEHLYNNQLMHCGIRHGYLALVDYARG